MSINQKKSVKCIAQKVNKKDGIVKEIVNATLEEIYNCLKKKESVNLRNFGIFYIQEKRDSTLFKFNPSQRLRKLFGWSSTYKGDI
ncbi:hypothetical protein GM3708_1553 [Geminocystis sp. NIES-3708]|uniref:HU family DNA-binding protein n=1 Tax=Geminocystis sp. NIES-3708 TaxID=1615909 RepID=UPI0005FC7FA7|nr:HU family DNA-binding protein [Geminocystis sp. NIES-3708]BAQ61147.1 hypothetical protein GM3708_1553 [Geminocystis sp. NIES-3708]